jgi:signal transduction histidine kinase
MSRAASTGLGMRARAAAVAVVGLALAALVGALLGKSAADMIVLIGVASACTLAAGLLGATVLKLLRNASFTAQISVVALTSVVAVAVGAVGAGTAMFLSSADLYALVIIVVAAGAVGICVAMVLADRVAAASRLLSESAARLVGAGTDGSPSKPSIREFADLAERLDETAIRLAEAHARESALESARRELVSWVSHDLRTPLAGIRAMSEALEDGVVDDPATVAEYHRTMRLEADRLAGLVDDLFELSRIHAGVLRLHLEPASLHDLVSDALAAADPVASVKGVRLQGRLVESVPELHLAPPEMSRVLRNLLGNAIRETPIDGTVAVEAGLDGDHAWVAVTDTCGGIPDKDLARVFDTSFRGHRPRTPSAEAGAGLGLAIAKGLVEAHHGELHVTNQGAGCRFTVRLPLVQPR